MEELNIYVCTNNFVADNETFIKDNFYIYIDTGSFTFQMGMWHFSSVDINMYSENFREATYKEKLYFFWKTKYGTRFIKEKIKEIEKEEETKKEKETKNDKEIKQDAVNHPSYYTSHPSGVECIDIARNYCFSIGCAIKYLWRAGLKKSDSLTNKEKEIQDLKKALWYINDRIKQLEEQK
jgi:hypothetical protein